MALDDDLKAVLGQATSGEPAFWQIEPSPRDPPAAGPRERPDWRQRYEQVFEGGLSIEWRARERKFWLVRQVESGSEDFIDAGCVFGVYPGAGEEHVLKSLWAGAEVIRARLQLGPDIRFKAIEMDPCTPGSQPSWWSPGSEGPITAVEKRAGAKGTQSGYWSFFGPIRALNEDAIAVVELSRRMCSGPGEGGGESSEDGGAGADGATEEVSEDGNGDEHLEVARGVEEQGMDVDYIERYFSGADEPPRDEAAGDDCAKNEISEEGTAGTSTWKPREVAKEPGIFLPATGIGHVGGYLSQAEPISTATRTVKHPSESAELGGETEPSRGPAEASPEPNAGSGRLRSEPRLARCKECGRVFLNSVIWGSPIQCDLCGANVAWQFAVPSGPRQPEAGSNKPTVHVDHLRLFTGRSFEQFLKMLFENMGFSVEETPATADQGADLILTAPSCRRTAVQAKRYNQDVGNAAVQEILGGMAYWGCDNGIVVSASGFTRAARDLASKAPAVILWDKPVLETLIDRYMSHIVVFVAERQPAQGA